MRMYISEEMLQESKHSKLQFAYTAVRLWEARPTLYELKCASTHTSKQLMNTGKVVKCHTCQHVSTMMRSSH